MTVLSLFRRPRRTETPIHFRSVARSHLGHVRRLNEDRVLDRPEVALWAVADGMGGHRGGDEAAQTIVDALRRLDPIDGAIAETAVLDALVTANRMVHDRNCTIGEQAGATLVSLGIQDDVAHIAWAGDSRCYRIRAGTVEQLTRDHSVVQELIDAGLLTVDAAGRHHQANVVTRALGVAATCDIATRTTDVLDGDRFLLCSDGLSRSLLATDLVNAPLDDLADALLANALNRDGSDNISFVLLAATD